jgi:hypothetical protein
MFFKVKQHGQKEDEGESKRYSEIKKITAMFEVLKVSPELQLTVFWIQ